MFRPRAVKRSRWAMLFLKFVSRRSGIIDSTQLTTQDTRPIPLQQIATERGHVLVGSGIGQFERRVDMSAVLQEQRHLGERLTESHMLEIRLGDLACQITGERERPIAG